MEALLGSRVVEKSLVMSGKALPPRTILTTISKLQKDLRMILGRETTAIITEIMVETMGETIVRVIIAPHIKVVTIVIDTVETIAIDMTTTGTTTAGTKIMVDTKIIDSTKDPRLVVVVEIILLTF